MADELLDPVWKALADPTRRRLLDLLRERPRTTGELCAAFPLSRVAVMKHLGVLEAAGLVAVRRHGRQRWNHLNAVPIQAIADRWIGPFAAEWTGRLLRLKDRLEIEPREKGATMAEQITACGVAYVEVELPIAAPPARVWRAIVEETSHWFRKEFHSVVDPSGFVVEPRAGGRIYETSRSGAEVLWGTVIAVDPGKSLDAVRHFPAAFGLPLTSIWHLGLEPQGEATLLRLSDSLIGRVSEETIAEFREGWRPIFADGLKPYVEDGVTA